ncbi:MAG TPA: radical SAM protein [Rhizomicrobium sp.]
MDTPVKLKPSVFNAQIPHNGKVLAFNSLIAFSLEMSEPQARIFNDTLDEIARIGRCEDEAFQRCLYALGFVVPADHDEIAAQQAAFRAAKADADTLRLTIAPTMACNMHCTYCFQQDFAACKTMQPEIERGIIEFVRRKSERSKTLVVQWFGGEPLLRLHRIAAMTEAFQSICAERGMRYYAEMLTNGVLLTPETVASLSKLAVRAIQIPLDGDIETYARRKGISLQRAQAFHDSLLDSMPSLLEATGSVTIRINVDRNNPAAGYDAVRMFKQKGCCDPRLDFRLGFLNNRDGIVDCIPHDCFSNAEFADTEAAFRRFLAEQGFQVYGEPGPRKYPCAAPLQNNFTISPDGRIGKCVPAIGTDDSVFGQIYPDDIERTMQETAAADAPYSDFDPYLGACSGCEFLPVCLGSCPRSHAPGRSVICALKEGLAETLAFYRVHD